MCRQVRKDWISDKQNIKAVRTSLSPQSGLLMKFKMNKTLLLKFTQHEDLKNLLLSTADAELVEVSRNVSICMKIELNTFPRGLSYRFLLGNWPRRQRPKSARASVDAHSKDIEGIWISTTSRIWWLRVCTCSSILEPKRAYSALYPRGSKFIWCIHVNCESIR